MACYTFSSVHLACQRVLTPLVWLVWGWEGRIALNMRSLATLDQMFREVTVNKTKKESMVFVQTSCSHIARHHRHLFLSASNPTNFDSGLLLNLDAAYPRVLPIVELLCPRFCLILRILEYPALQL